MKTKTRFILVLAAGGLALIGVAAQFERVKLDPVKMNRQYSYTGYTGHPLGEEITIRGHKNNVTFFSFGEIGGRNGTGKTTFQVEAVNDEKRADTIQVEGIESWPDKTDATLRGYEQANIRYLHAEDTTFPKGFPKDKDFVPRQAVILTFHVTEIVEPKTLRLSNEKK